MNRRTAIKRIFILGGASAISYLGFRSYNIYKTPDLKILDKHKDLIAHLAETIIPKTQSPGAMEAGVGNFIDHMVKNAANTQTQNNFLEGLEDLVDWTQQQFNKSFMFCSQQEKIAVLTHFEEKGKSPGGFIGKVEAKLLGDSFFSTLKKFTVIGYCTSMEGVTNGLAYDYIPGKFRSIIKLEPGQKSWAIQ